MRPASIATAPAFFGCRRLEPRWLIQFQVPELKCYFDHSCPLTKVIFVVVAVRISCKILSSWLFHRFRPQALSFHCGRYLIHGRIPSAAPSPLSVTSRTRWHEQGREIGQMNYISHREKDATEEGKRTLRSPDLYGRPSKAAESVLCRHRGRL